MDPWKLLELGQYQQAIAVYTRKLRREPTEWGYSGRAEAFVRLKDYDRALADSHAAEAESQYPCTHYRERIGVVNWLAGRENTAAGTWLDLSLCARSNSTSAFARWSPAILSKPESCFEWPASVRTPRSKMSTIWQIEKANDDVLVRNIGRDRDFTS